MRKLSIGIAALAALTLHGTASVADSTPGAGPTARASATTVNVTGVSRYVVYSEERGWPKPGTTQVALNVGRSTGGPQPTSSIGIGRTTITGHPTRNTWTYKATGEDFTYGVGALRTVLTGKYTLRRGMMLDTARGHVVEGTGLFAGVTGTFTTTGRNRVGARVFEYVTHGTYTFP